MSCSGSWAAPTVATVKILDRSAIRSAATWRSADVSSLSWAASRPNSASGECAGERATRLSSDCASSAPTAPVEFTTCPTHGSGISYRRRGSAGGCSSGARSAKGLRRAVCTGCTTSPRWPPSAAMCAASSQRRCPHHFVSGIRSQDRHAAAGRHRHHRLAIRHRRRLRGRVDPTASPDASSTTRVAPGGERTAA